MPFLQTKMHGTAILDVRNSPVIKVENEEVCAI